MQRYAPFVHPFLCEARKTLSLILLDLKHADMHLHAENKCDASAAWHDAQ